MPAGTGFPDGRLKRVQRNVANIYKFTQFRMCFYRRKVVLRNTPASNESKSYFAVLNW